MKPLKRSNLIRRLKGHLAGQHYGKVVSKWIRRYKCFVADCRPCRVSGLGRTMSEALLDNSRRVAVDLRQEEIWQNHKNGRHRHFVRFTQARKPRGYIAKCRPCNHGAFGRSRAEAKFNLETVVACCVSD